MKHVVLNREFGIVRTVAVFGPGRGGTSVIAGCLRALGVCMGTAPHPYKHEWSPIVRPVGDKIDLAQTYHIIQQMNASHPWWGWKFPSDVFQLDTITPLLRNPGFIVVTRDLTEVALSAQARQDIPFELSMRDTAVVCRYIADRMQFWPWPILVLPFAEALREPGTLVEVLCAFLQIDPGDKERKQAADFVQPLTRGYRPFDAKPDQLHDFSPPQDNLSDSQKLAVDFSARYSQMYSHQFEAVLADTKASTDLLAARIRSPHELAIASQIMTELQNLFCECAADGIGGLAKPPADITFGSTRAWRAAVDQLVKELSNTAQKAGKEALHSSGDYDALIRLYRALQLLIRVRVALETGLRGIEFKTI